MRVLLVAPFFPPEITGSSNFVYDLATGLSELGHCVRVVTAVDSQPHDCFDVLSLRAKRIRPGRIAFGYSIPIVTNRSNYRRLEDLVDSFKPDVVSLHGQIFDITLLAAAIAKKRNVPTIMTVHSAIWHDNPFLNRVLALGDRLLSVLLLRRLCNSWIAVDDRTLNHVRRRYSESCTSIPICVRRNVFAGGCSDLARDKYGIKGNPVIASIGHVVPVRNRLPLIDALPHLVAEFPNLQVAIVGRVADERFLERAELLGVAQHLRVLGSIPHSEVAHVLAAAQVELHDLQGLGLGIGSLEAIDAGVPIVAYAKDDNIPGVSLRSFCPEAFVEQNDAKTLSSVVVRLLSDQDFRDRVLAQQRQLLDDVYYLEKIATKYVEEFQRVITR